MRLLHSFVCKIFVPRSGKFDYITEKDLQVMHHNICEYPLDLSTFVIHRMQEAITKSKGNLPFGMAFSLVFKLVGINLEDEQRRVLHHSDTYNMHSLHHMGYEKVNGNWIRKGSSRKKKPKNLKEEQESSNQATSEAQLQDSSFRHAGASQSSSGLEGHVSTLYKLTSNLDFKMRNMHQLINNLVQWVVMVEDVVKAI